MNSNKCSWGEQCRNGDDGCWILNPETCVRFLPLNATNLTRIKGIIETQPDINTDKFSQYFSNWINAMGWSFVGTFGSYNEKSEKNI